MVGFARRDWDDAAFRDEMRTSLGEKAAQEVDDASWGAFASCLHFTRGHFDSPADYAKLQDKLKTLREKHDLPDNVFFHLAAPPSFFPTIVDGLAGSGLAREQGGWRRLVIEKPFGRDESSAAELECAVQRSFDEKQVYRIDHFLGKETVQNLLVFRFANPSFEPVWNRNYIDHVQITAAEDGGIRGRGKFYETTGVMRDMVQNHLLQLLCTVAIEPPLRFDANGLRNETIKVLEAIRPPDVANDCVAGQYGSGEIDGERLPGYREEEDVEDDSKTATFTALKLEVDNWRWSGVPFYLRTGKRLARKLTEIVIHFKPTPHSMFGWDDGAPRSSGIAFRLAPEEGIVQSFLGKQPGPGLCIRPVRMNFCYADAFGVEEPPSAYAWLLLDVMRGDQTLFARADWIRRAWSIVDPLVEHWERRPPADLPNYRAGSWGPAAADDLIARDGRTWKAI
jgi:glucose-6-phosphate 1-dehydrogenase